MDILLQLIVNGLLIGGVYGLISVGLTLVFGVLRIVNFAHGELLMLGMFAGFWAYREMAPTRPAVAGLLVGLSAGAAAAFAYALYCPETTASFLLAAYTPGAVLAALAGMAAGPKLLRW